MSLDQTNAFYVSDTQTHMQGESLKWTQPKKQKPSQSQSVANISLYMVSLWNIQVD